MNQKETVKVLQNLLFSEPKPAKLRPVDIALISYLILRQTEDHYIFDSHLTLADRLGCERRTIADSITRLSAMGWITTRKPCQWNEKTKRKTRAIGKTVGLSVVLDKLPQAGDKPKRSRPSPEAVSLAANHTAFLKQLGVSTTYKRFGSQQQYAAQRLIDELGSSEVVEDLIQFAIDDQRFRSAAYKSLYEIRSRISAIKTAYVSAKCAVASPVSG